MGLLLKGGERRGGEWRGRGGDVRGGECCGVQKIFKIDPAGQPAMHAVRDIVLPIILALCVSNAGIASTRMDKSSQFF